MAVRLSRQAEVDLRELWAFVATESGEERADRVVDALTDACWILSEYPRVGRLRPDVGPNVRSFPVSGYVVYYRVENEDVVSIARVLHARRDQSATWESEE